MESLCSSVLTVCDKFLVTNDKLNWSTATSSKRVEFPFSRKQLIKNSSAKKLSYHCRDYWWGSTTPALPLSKAAINIIIQEIHDWFIFPEKMELLWDYIDTLLEGYGERYGIPKPLPYNMRGLGSSPKYFKPKLLVNQSHDLLPYIPKIYYDTAICAIYGCRLRGRIRNTISQSLTLRALVN